MWHTSISFFSFLLYGTKSFFFSQAKLSVEEHEAKGHCLSVHVFSIARNFIFPVVVRAWSAQSSNLRSYKLAHCETKGCQLGLRSRVIPGCVFLKVLGQVPCCEQDGQNSYIQEQSLRHFLSVLCSPAVFNYTSSWVKFPTSFKSPWPIPEFMQLKVVDTVSDFLLFVF